MSVGGLGAEMKLTNPITGGALGNPLMLGVKDDGRDDAEETAEQTDGGEEPQPKVGRK